MSKIRIRHTIGNWAFSPDFPKGGEIEDVIRYSWATKTVGNHVYGSLALVLEYNKNENSRVLPLLTKLTPALKRHGLEQVDRLENDHAVMIVFFRPVYFNKDNLRRFTSAVGELGWVPVSYMGEFVGYYPTRESVPSWLEIEGG